MPLAVGNVGLEHLSLDICSIPFAAVINIALN